MTDLISGETARRPAGRRRVVIVAPVDWRGLAARWGRGSLSALAGLQPLPSPPVEHLVEGLLAADIAVDLVTCSPTTREPAIAESDDLSVFVAPYRLGGRGADAFREERRALSGLLARTTGDLVHAHWTYEFAMATLSDPRPRVITIHDAPLTILRYRPDPYRMVRAAMAYRVRTAPFTGIAVSPYIADRWRVQMRDARPLQVVPNAVMGKQSVNQGVATGGPTAELVAVADSSRWKNVTRLLDAFRIVRQSWPQAQLSLVGSGLGEGDLLATTARRQGRSAGVRWHGPVPHAVCLDLIAGADVFVHPSLEESFGMAVTEAMTAGVPVVAGERSGAMPWILEDGRAGVLVDVRSAESLAEGVGRLLRDPSLQAVLRRRACERVAAFSREVVVSRHLDIYERAVLQDGLTKPGAARRVRFAATQRRGTDE